MSALFDMPAADLTLTSDELAKITGHARAQGQLDWLKAYRWHHHINKAGQPVVGRLYATMKLSGVEVKHMIQPEAWQPDFAGLQ